jgi:hypothetical protein
MIFSFVNIILGEGKGAGLFKFIASVTYIRFSPSSTHGLLAGIGFGFHIVLTDNLSIGERVAGEVWRSAK